jgi:superfamily I DNA/RNA helicase
MAWNDKEFVPAWLSDKFDEADPFHKLVLDLALEVETPADLLDALVAAVSLPDIPPDVTEVRIMSLHKSKGLSSPVVIIAGCVEGLLPTAPDEDLPPADRDAKLEEERRLFFVGLTRVKAEPGHGKPGVQVVTSSRTMSIADAKQSGIRPARVVYGTVHLHASRFIQELGPAAPATVRG